MSSRMKLAERPGVDGRNTFLSQQSWSEVRRISISTRERMAVLTIPVLTSWIWLRVFVLPWIRMARQIDTRRKTFCMSTEDADKLLAAIIFEKPSDRSKRKCLFQSTSANVSKHGTFEGRLDIHSRHHRTRGF